MNDSADVTMNTFGFRGFNGVVEIGENLPTWVVLRAAQTLCLMSKNTSQNIV